MPEVNREASQIKAGAVLSYISMCLGFAISIAYTPIMLRLLGQSEYGLYSLVASVVSYLGLLNFGFGSAYIRYYSRYKVNNEVENIAKLNGMFMVIFSIIGLIAVLAGTVLVFNVRTIFGNKLSAGEFIKVKIIMAIMVFNMALSFFASVFNSNITANEKYIFQKTLQMFRLVVSPFVVLPVLLMGYKSVGMVVAATAINVIIEISNVVFCFKRMKMKLLFHKFDFQLMREMAIFSSFIFLNIIVDQINWNVGKYIVGRFRGTVAVAIYGLAAQLNNYYMSLSTALSGVLVSRVNRMVAETDNNEELTNMFTRIAVRFSVIDLFFWGKNYFLSNNSLA